MKKILFALLLLCFLLSGCSSSPDSKNISPKTDREHDIYFAAYDEGYKSGYDDGWEDGGIFASENLYDWVPYVEDFYDFLDYCVEVGHIKSYKK